MKISHVAWNLAGMSIPVLVAAATVPALLENLGKEKFGLLALAWGLIGYAGSLDLGLGRAVTQMVASLRGERKLVSVGDILATASGITLATGLIVGALIALFALLGGAGIFQIQSTPESELHSAILLMAVALPAQAMSATYKGLNEAFMNFKQISILRAALGIINFFGPYAVSFFTTQLPWLVSTLVISRLVALIIYRWLASRCLRNEPEIKKTTQFSLTIAKRLFTFGGWVTVSSIIGPLMAQSDRFFIAIMISAAAVSIYVLPYELVVQCLLLVGAVTTVMFPGLSQLMNEQPNAWRSYFRKWLLRIAVLMAVVCTGMAILLPVIMGLWVGDQLDAKSVVIGQILCLGVFANSLGSMYYAAIQAKGRADITAKLHAIELPFYLLFLYFVVESFGLLGVATAWTGRMIIDVMALYFIDIKVNKESR